MHKVTTKRLGEGLRKAYQTPGDLPEAMQLLLQQLVQPSEPTPANDEADPSASYAPDRPCRPVRA